MPFVNGNIEGGQIIVPVTILRQGESAAIPHPDHTYGALIDTGATITCISPRVAKDLDIQPEGRRPMTSATEMTNANLYHIDLHIPIDTESEPDQHGVVHSETMVLSNYKIEVMEILQMEDYEVLLGMDMLRQCSLFISGDRFIFGY